MPCRAGLLDALVCRAALLPHGCSGRRKAPAAREARASLRSVCRLVVWSCVGLLHVA